MITQHRKIRLSNELTKTISDGYEYTIEITTDEPHPVFALQAIDAIELEIADIKQRLQSEYNNREADGLGR